MCNLHPVKHTLSLTSVVRSTDVYDGVPTTVKIQNTSVTSTKFLHASSPTWGPKPSASPPPPPATPNLISVPRVSPFPEGHINGIIRYVVQGARCLSLRLRLLRFAHVVVGTSTVFLFTAEKYSTAGPFHTVYPSIAGWTVGLFAVRGNYERGCRDHSQVSLCVNICFMSLELIPRSCIASALDQRPFNCLRNCQTGSQSACAVLHGDQERLKVLLLPHGFILPASSFFFFFLFSFAFLASA